MEIAILSSLQVVDFSHGGWRYRDLTPGLYIVEEIENPIGLPGSWFVLQGTSTGIGKEVWYRKRHIGCRSKRARLRSAVTI